MSLAAGPTRSLSLSKLIAGQNPRGRTFKVDDLERSFAKSPQLQNIVVRRLPGPRERYQVIAGHRRVEAARRQKWSHIEAKVVDVSDEVAESYALEENLRRKALPDEVTATARLVEIYKARGAGHRGGDRRSKKFQAGSAPGSDSQVGRLKGSAVTQAAQATGQSVTDVRRKARVGRLAIDAVKIALSEKRINVLEADKLVRLPAGQQADKLHALVKAKESSPQDRKVQKAVDALAYVETVVRALKSGSLDSEGAGVLRAGLAGVTAALDEVAGKGRGGRRASAGPVAIIAPGRDLSGSVKLELESCNRKLGPVGLSPGRSRSHFHAMPPYVASTLVSIQATCSDACAFKGTPADPGGCYVDAGFTRIAMQKLDAASWGVAAPEVIREEARQIDDAFDGGPIPQDGARGGRDLRLHVGGDVGSVDGAKTLARAARRWKARGGGTVWSYTHDWREVPRSAWGDAITVFASVERSQDIEKARKRGYPAAIVVQDFPEGAKTFTLPGTTAKVTPCPAETGQATCADCRLCLDRDALKLNVAIAFKLHGQQASVANVKLEEARGG